MRETDCRFDFVSVLATRARSPQSLNLALCEKLSIWECGRMKRTVIHEVNSVREEGKGLIDQQEDD